MSPPTLYLHAFGGAARDWAGVRERLPAGLGGEAPDLPGFAGAPDLPEVTFDAYVEWIAARLGGAPTRIVAHSMSGKLALALAARRPERVAHLILIAPSTPGAEPMEPGDRRDLLARFGDRTSAREAVAADGRALSPAALDQLVEDRLAVSHAAWRWWLGAGSLLDIGPETARVVAPVDVIVGDGDAHLGEAAQRRHLLPRLVHGPARLHVIAGSGHFVPLEQPDALAAKLQEIAA